MPTATTHATKPAARAPSPANAIESRGYARPDLLVSTTWLAAHLDDADLRVLESSEDVLLYDVGHIPTSQKLDWHADLNDPITRDYISSQEFQCLLRQLGVNESTTVVFYGDKNNWWATYAFWVFRLFDFPESRLRILDGGRSKWESEGWPLVADTPEFAETQYIAKARDDRRIRAFRDEVLKHSSAGKPLIDVRSPDEYYGLRTHMPEYPQEGVLRGGHVPGAANVPWARAAAPDGTFRPADELRAIYEGEAGLRPELDTITYCRIGERSSHTWFVLTYLLGYPNVRNYDGSWTEWGNSVRLPIARSERPGDA